MTDASAVMKASAAITVGMMVGFAIGLAVGLEALGYSQVAEMKATLTEQHNAIAALTFQINRAIEKGSAR